MGLFDDLVDVGEDLWEDGKRLVGEGVDAVTDVTADGLDVLGFEGAADNVRDWGDSVADQLGATPDEMSLGETREPRELVHGDPGLMRERSGKLDDFAADFTAAGQGLQAMSVGDWSGDASDAYHRKVSEEYPKWFTAAEACTAASGAVTQLAGAVEWAQGQAAEAIRLWDEAQAQHDAWQQRYDDYTSGATDTHPGTDPGPALRDNAVEVLNAAREHRNGAAETAASTLNDAAGDAPPLPPGGDRLMADLGDLYATGQMFSSHALVGLVGAFTDLGRLVRTVNPTDPYNVAHPADYLANSTSVAAGLVNMAAHPDELVRGFIGTNWGTDPGQATGTLLSNFIPFGPKGTGVVRSTLADATRTAPRAALDDAARAGAPDGAGRTVPLYSPNAPQATPSTTPTDAPGPAARPHDTPAPAAGHDAPTPREPGTTATSEPPAAPEPSPTPSAGPEAPPAHDPPAAGRDAETSPTDGSRPAPERHEPAPRDIDTTADTSSAPDRPAEHNPTPTSRPEDAAPPRVPDDGGTPPDPVNPAPERADTPPHGSGPDDPDSTRAYPDQHNGVDTDTPHRGNGPDAQPSGRPETGADATPVRVDAEPSAPRAETPTARADTDTAPRTAEATPPRTDGDAPPRTDTNAPPRTDTDAPPRTDSDAPPRSDTDAPPRTDGDPPPGARTDTDGVPAHSDPDPPHPDSDATLPARTDPDAPPTTTPRADGQNPPGATGAVPFGHTPTPHALPDGPRSPDAPRTDTPRADTATPRADTPRGEPTTPRDTPTGRDSTTSRDGASQRDSTGDRPSPQARPSSDSRSTPTPAARATDSAPTSNPSDRSTPQNTPTGTAPVAAMPDTAVVPHYPTHSAHPDAPRTGPDQPGTGNGSDGGPDGPGQHHTPNHRVADDADHPAAATEPQNRSACGEPVDAATGEYVLPAVDVDLAAVLPLRLTRTHRSQYRHGVWLGPSWSCTFDTRVVITETAVTTIDADGTMLLFDPPTGDEPSTARHGRPWRLFATPTGGYRLEPPDGALTYHFEPKPQVGGADLAAGVVFISAITDVHHNRMLFTYTEDGAPSGVAHSGGYRIGVDSDGRRIRGYTLATDAASTVLRRFGYTAGDLTSVTDATGATTRFDYDDHHRMVSWTDSLGATYSNTYDDQGRVVAQGGRDGVWAGTFAYREDPDGTGRSTVYTDALGARTVFGFDRDLRARAIADPMGRITRRDFNSARQPLAVTDPAGALTALRYTPGGDLAQITDPLGHTTTVRYTDTAQGPRPAELTDATGGVTTYRYDDDGNVVAMRDPAGGMWRWEYTTGGALHARTDPLGRRVTVSCNAAGLPTRLTDALGAQTTIDYDRFGRPVRMVEPDDATTLLHYDREGRLLSRRAPDGATDTWTYDGEGNRVAHTDPTGATTRWEYGFFDLVTARIDPDGARTTYSYDRARRLVSVTNPAGLVWRYEYYPDGRLAAETDFDGARLQYTYDAAGRLASRTNAAGQVLTYTYDAAGRLIAETSTVTGDADDAARRYAGEQITYRYDALGRLTGTQLPSHSVHFERDAAGRVIAETLDGHTVHLQRNAAGDVVRTVTPSGHDTTVSYDSRGLVDTVTVAGQRCDISTDTAGRLTRIQFGTSAIDSRFDAAGRLSSRSVLTGLRDLTTLNLDVGVQTPTSVTAAATYAYRADGALAAIDAAGHATLSVPAHYTTDPVGRLASRVLADGTAEVFDFDASGNLTGVDRRGVGYAAQPPTQWRYDGVRLVDDGRSRYHYDRAGRVTSVSTRRLSRKPDVWHYEWDAWDRLRSVVTPDGRRYEYRYDANGRRITKVAPDGSRVEFFWAGGRLVEQRVLADGDDAAAEVTTWSYLPDRHTPLTQTHADDAAATLNNLEAGNLDLDGHHKSRVLPQSEVDRRFYALVTDHLDTPVALLDPDTGQLAGRATATVWGDTRWSGVGTPWRFPGQYADDETGLHYNFHRYYHPNTGRYLSPDPLGLAPAPNPYAYPSNPTIWADPWGLSPCSTSPWSPTYNELRTSPLDGHHIIQDAAVRGWSNPVTGEAYSRSQAPAIELGGGASRVGSEHYLATQAQNASVHGGTYGAEREVAREALLAAGKSLQDVERALARADEYFMQHLGMTMDTELRIPGSRWGVR